MFEAARIVDAAPVPGRVARGNPRGFAQRRIDKDDILGSRQCRKAQLPRVEKIAAEHFAARTSAAKIENILRHVAPAKHGQVARQQFQAQRMRLARGGRAALPAKRSADDDVRLRGAGLVGHLQQIIGVERVVGVKERHIFAPRRVQRQVARHAGAGAFLRHHGDPSVARSVFAQDIGRVVRRTVVDAQQLERSQRLSQHAFHRFAQIPLRVVNGHDDRDSGALLRGAAAPFLKARRQAQIFQRPKIILVRKRRDEILADVVCVEAPDKLFDAFVKGVNVFSPFQPTEIFFKKAIEFPPANQPRRCLRQRGRRLADRSIRNNPLFEGRRFRFGDRALGNGNVGDHQALRRSQTTHGEATFAAVRQGRKRKAALAHELGSVQPVNGGAHLEQLARRFGEGSDRPQFRAVAVVPQRRQLCFAAVRVLQTHGPFDKIQLVFHSRIVQPPQTVGKQSVPGVEKDRVLARGGVKPAVARGRQSGVFLRQHRNARLLGGPAHQHVQRSVGRAVVDADHFQLRQRLTQNAPQHVFEIFFHVVHGDDDAHERMSGLILFHDDTGRFLLIHKRFHRHDLSVEK